MRLDGEKAYCKIYDLHGSPLDEFIIDSCDLGLIEGKHFCRTSNGYANSRKHGYLHRMIMKPEKGFVVDHINRNKLDNRRSNLRVITNASNLVNTKAKGYYWHKKARKYCVYIGSSDTGTYKYLGLVDTIEEAIEKRSIAKLEIYGV